MKASQKIIDSVLDWARLGVNLGGIASAMQAEGFKSPAGGAGWGAAVVRDILAEAGVDVANLAAGGGPEGPEGPDDDDDPDWQASHCGTKFKADLP